MVLQVSQVIIRLHLSGKLEVVKLLTEPTKRLLAAGNVLTGEMPFSPYDDRITIAVQIVIMRHQYS